MLTSYMSPRSIVCKYVFSQSPNAQTVKSKVYSCPVRSCILCVSDHFTLDFAPVDLPVNLLVYLTAYDYIVPSNQIQPVLNLR